jgi:methionine synthase I (cobalamin-dependent)
MSARAKNRIVSVMVGAGAMGTQPQAADLGLTDFNNLETKYVRLQSS